ncbi:MAG TPA: arginine deiminase family protein, partial [Thermoplasmata archaeon]|nr:arginine deiminase family protein [Thermoplasmata archaeon]
PVPLWKELKERGFDLLEASDEEFRTMAPNILALAPRHVVLLRGNPITASHLEAAGCRVEIYVGDEISMKAEGGPTCLTRPILREY